MKKKYLQNTKENPMLGFVAAAPRKADSDIQYAFRWQNNVNENRMAVSIQRFANPGFYAAELYFCGSNRMDNCRLN